MKPVIVHIIQHFKPGGIETLAIEMLKRNQHFNMHIVALEGHIDDAISHFPVLDDFRTQIHCLGKPDGIQWQTVKSLRGLLIELNAVACVSHHIGPLFYTTLAKTGLSTEHFHTEHDAWHLNDPSRERLQYWCLKIAQPTIIADARIVAGVLEKKFPFIKPHVIHNGIDTERFKPGLKCSARDQLDLPKYKKLIGCAARLEPVKQIHRLVNALKDLPEDVHLVIAGSGSEKLPLIRQANNLNLSDRVHFLGYLSEPEVFYQAIDVFCLVSKHEGFPLSSIEAQACNVPVVLSDVGGNRETLCQRTGLLLVNDDHTQLVNSIKCQISRAKLLAPRAHVEKLFTIEVMLNNYESLISSATYKQEVA